MNRKKNGGVNRGRIGSCGAPRRRREPGNHLRANGSFLIPVSGRDRRAAEFPASNSLNFSPAHRGTEKTTVLFHDRVTPRGKCIRH